MKPYLLTTGLLFGLMTAIHIWRAIAEWPKQGLNPGFVLLMLALVAIPGVLAWWAFRLLQNLPGNGIKAASKKDQG
jgi:hypothetical protein